MARMRKIVITAVLACWCAVMWADNANYNNEVLNYEIVYEWGLIWKHAANASLSIKKTNGGYVSQLLGSTRSWADKVYRVRDTLRCTMNNELQPIKYEKFTHEGKYYARDVVDYYYTLGRTKAKCSRKWPDDPTKQDLNIELEARAQAYDMVSVFYMLRALDYSKMTKGSIVSSIVFSGKQKEYLTITYHGTEKVKLRDKTSHVAHKVTFRFTQEGGKKSSENIEVWLSTDSRHVPLMLKGTLAVGAIKCYYKA
ncbi:MAG: DUF3108 domain-containing protein [Muribaculaceae bacterium]|nr:DUF3108 domain-containing protein [Muribaculaceae bacterium]